MDFQQLRVFREAVRAGGFTRAGEEIHLSQSTVSLHIKRLEEEVGMPLFVRTKRRVQLNDAGKLLLEYVDRVFLELSKAEHALQEFGQAERGIVRVGSGGTTLTYLLPEVLGTYRQRFPQVELIVTTDSSEALAMGVHKGKLDLAVVMHPVREGLSIELLPLLKEELVFVVGKTAHSHEKGKIAECEVSRLPFISFLRGSTMQVAIDRQLIDLNIGIKSTMEMENIEAIKAVVRAGVGAAILPISSIDPDDAFLRVLRLPVHLLYRELALALPSNASLSKSVQRFATRLSRHFTGKSISELRAFVSGHHDIP